MCYVTLDTKMILFLGQGRLVMPGVRGLCCAGADELQGIKEATGSVVWFSRVLTRDSKNRLRSSLYFALDGCLLPDMYEAAQPKADASCQVILWF